MMSKFAPINVILTLFCSILRFDNAHWDFWLEFRVFPPKLGVKIFFYNSNPQKALPYAKTRLLTHERSKSVQGSDLWRRARTPKKKHKNKKTKKVRHLTMLGISGGEQGYPIGLKFFGGTVGPNVMADDHPDDYRTSVSWATTP